MRAARQDYSEHSAAMRFFGQARGVVRREIADGLIERLVIDVPSLLNVDETDAGTIRVRALRRAGTVLRGWQVDAVTCQIALLGNIRIVLESSRARRRRDFRRLDFFLDVRSQQVGLAG